MKNLFLCIILSVFSIINSFGQLERDSTKMVMVTTMDGKERVGYILEDNGREILLMTESIDANCICNNRYFLFTEI